MEREVRTMRSLILAILISLFLAGHVSADPYIGLYPYDYDAELFGYIDVVTCTTGQTVTTTCGDQYSLAGAVIEVPSGTITLPAAHAGMWACVKSTTAAVISIDIDDNDQWYLDGVPLSAGDQIDSPGNLDDTVCFYASTDDIWKTVHNPDIFVDGD